MRPYRGEARPLRCETPPRNKDLQLNDLNMKPKSLITYPDILYFCDLWYWGQATYKTFAGVSQPYKQGSSSSRWDIMIVCDNSNYNI